MAADQSFVTRSVAGLLLLDFSMKQLMTTLRINGAKGQGQPMSFFEKASRAQLLTAEYTGPMCALIIALAIKGPLSDWAKNVVKAMIASRWIFALRMFDFSVDASGYLNGKPITNPLHVYKLSFPGVVGATLSYITYGLLILELVRS